MYIIVLTLIRSYELWYKKIYMIWIGSFYKTINRTLLDQKIITKNNRTFNSHLIKSGVIEKKIIVFQIWYIFEGKLQN